MLERIKNKWANEMGKRAAFTSKAWLKFIRVTREGKGTQ